MLKPFFPFPGFSSRLDGVTNGMRERCKARTAPVTKAEPNDGGQTIHQPLVRPAVSESLCERQPVAPASRSNQAISARTLLHSLHQLQGGGGEGERGTEGREEGREGRRWGLI